jgi:hypothetical protein
LPGQEEINLGNLKNWGLVYHLENWKESPDFEENLVKILHCDKHQKRLNQQLDTYHQQLSKENISVFIEKLLANNNTK